MEEALEGLSGYRRIVDDIVIYDKDPQQYVQHVKQFLQWCSDKQLSPNREKWQFHQSQVTFVGFHLSSHCKNNFVILTKSISQGK